MPGGALEAGGDVAVGLARQMVDALADVAVGGLDEAVGEQHQDVTGAQGALGGVELGAVVDAEQRALGGLLLPFAGARAELERGQMTGGEELEVAAVEVEYEVDGGREALFPVLAQEIAVGGGEEAVRGQRAEEAAEGAGEQEGAGGGVHALAGDVGEDDFEGAAAVAGAGGDHEVAGEGLAAGRAQRHLAVPAARQGGQLALDADAFAQVEEHGAAAPPGHADPAAELGDEQPEEADGGDHEDGAGGDPGGGVPRCTGRGRRTPR